MAAPGWYPDPSGRPGLFRYWDGRQWSSATTTNPSGAPAPVPARASETERRNPAALLLILLLALTLLVGGVLWWRSRGGSGLAAEDDNTSTPTISAWDENSSNPSPSATEEPTDSGGRPVACPEVHTEPAPGQPSNGRYAGGGLSYAEIPGWENSGGWGVDWASDTAGQRDPVVDNWVSIAVVGEIDKVHFPDARSAARMLTSCEATSFYYPNLTGRRDLVNQAVTVDGKPGWHLRSELTVAHRAVEGDVLDVVVVDAGREGKLAVFVTEAPIGDEARLRLASEALASLQVEG